MNVPSNYYFTQQLDKLVSGVKSLIITCRHVIYDCIYCYFDQDTASL
jgi:hypothetical protein